jgi:hypothetical protein
MDAIHWPVPDTNPYSQMKNPAQGGDKLGVVLKASHPLVRDGKLEVEQATDSRLTDYQTQRKLIRTRNQ